MRRRGLTLGTIAAALLGIGAAAAADTSRAVTIVLSEALQTVEPCQASVSTVGRVIKENVVETLTEIDPTTGAVHPRLASGWTQADAATWRFTLRDGVTFHDGSPFDADAVRHSIQRTMDTSLTCMNRNKYFAGVTLTVRPVDARTIEITADPPQPILPAMLSTMTIVAKTTPMGTPTAKPVGTGPYMLKSWDQSQKLVLERFAGYWGARPAVEQATYVWRAESSVRAAMVATGEADIAPAISTEDATDPVTDFSYPNSETSRIRIGMDRPPLDDVRVRQALNLAVDRQSFVGSILSKGVQPAAELVLPAVDGYNPDLRPWVFDPGKARQLLAAAKADGVPVGVQINLIGRTNIFPNAHETLEALTQMWAAAGLNVRLQMLDVAQALKLGTKPYAEDRPPTLIIDQHDNNTGDAGLTLTYKYSGKGGQSDTDDAELNRIIAQGSAASGPERTRLFRQAFARIGQQVVPDIMLFHMVGYTRVSSRLVFRPTIATNSELQLAQIAFK